MNTIAAILLIIGAGLMWLGGYMRGLEVGQVRGRIAYRQLERVKSESK